MTYRIELTTPAETALLKLSPRMRVRVVGHLRYLAVSPDAMASRRGNGLWMRLGGLDSLRHAVVEGCALTYDVDEAAHILRVRALTPPEGSVDISQDA